MALRSSAPYFECQLLVVINAPIRLNLDTYTLLLIARVISGVLGSQVVTRENVIRILQR